MARGSWRESLGRLVTAVVREGIRPARGGRPAAVRRRGRSAAPGKTPVPPAAGALDLDYAPRDDGHPDPGEIVWAWVPFEEDDGRGKDRPVLVVGRDGDTLLGLMLSSKDHDLDAADEARHGRHWVDVGTGAWDRQGRPSEARVDRLLRLDPADVRREGAVLARERFDDVAAEVRRHHG
ncbi:type II toxin-antitoxin system PemK/MazF family toxin [Modestobacter marinus]|uniref:type II toxin-antitoxin system PemK/MazF family toxin n=1 Tax=Modestobacter marinus TaxID=477641 RepID=UPI001C938B5C|nr:type II toxin-antitoxin system PemK/MazF family toxin [Modestobacter marinus]